MKQCCHFLLSLMAVGCAISACNVLGEPDAVKKVTFSISPFTLVGDDVPLTKTSIVVDGGDNLFVWAARDTCGVYPDTGSQIWFSMESGVGAKTAQFDGGGWALKPSSTYYSYYPFIGNIYLNRNHIPVSFTGQKQPGTSSIEHIGKYDYMCTAGSMTDEAGHLNFQYNHLCCIIRPNVTLPAGTWTKLAITAPTAVFAKKGYYNLMADQPVIIPTETSNQIQIDLEGITLTQETNFRVYVLSAPVNLKGVQITVSVMNDQRAEYQCKKTPSVEYPASFIGGLTCNSWEAVPQSMGLILEDWGDGGSISGQAE